MATQSVSSELTVRITPNDKGKPVVSENLSDVSGVDGKETQATTLDK